MVASTMEQIITVGYQIGLQVLLDENDYYTAKSMSAAKCAATSGFINTWYLNAALYYLALFLN